MPRRGRSVQLLQIMKEKTSARSDIASIDSVNLVNEIRKPGRQSSVSILASKMTSLAEDNPLRPFEVNQARYQDKIKQTIQAIKSKQTHLRESPYLLSPPQPKPRAAVDSFLPSISKRELPRHDTHLRNIQSIEFQSQQKIKQSKTDTFRPHRCKPQRYKVERF